MSTTHFNIENQFYLQSKIKDISIDWNLEMEPAKLKYDKKTTHRYGEIFRKREDKKIIHLPVSGYSIARLVAEKFNESYVLEDYTELTFVPECGDINADSICDFLNRKTKNILWESENALTKYLTQKYDVETKMVINAPTLSLDSGSNPVKLSKTMVPIVGLTLNFEDIKIEKDGIPFYLKAPHTHYSLDISKEHIDTQMTVPPSIATNICLTLIESSSPNSVHDSFKPSELIKLNNQEGIVLQPFVNLPITKRRLNNFNDEHTSNSSGGLLVSVVANDYHVLNEQIFFLKNYLGPRIEKYKLQVEYLSDAPDFIDEEDLGIIEKVKKK